MTVYQHLLDRHMDMRLHTVWIAEDLGCAIFPLWNLSGQLLGYQRYRPDASKALNNDPREGRYFTRLVNSCTTVWGLESWSLSNTLFVTEGIFDAARLTARGYSAVATLSNNVSPTLASWLWVTRKTRPVVVVCDNDAAGRSLARYGSTSHTVTGYKDLGEATNSYVDSVIDQYA